MYIFKADRCISILILLTALALVLGGGCAAKQKGPEQKPADLPESGKTFFNDLKEPPSHDLFTRSLEYYESQTGIRFFRNNQGQLAPFAAAAWNHFFIADAENECLYEIETHRTRSFQHLEGRYQTILDMQVQRGPCGLKAPNVNNDALDYLQNMEGNVISKQLLKYITEGRHLHADHTFLQDALQIPWKLESASYGLETFINANCERIENPLDITFGDIIVYSEYVGEWTVGIYVGYGLMVTNCCFQTNVHRLNTTDVYRVYRLFSGFGQVQYKVHQDTVLYQYLSNPKEGF